MLMRGQPARAGGGRLGARGRARRAARAADDPGAARRPHRPAARRRAHAPHARVGGGKRSSTARRCASSRPPALRPVVDRCLSELVRRDLIRPERAGLRRRRRVPLPPHPHPRRRLPLAAQGHARRAARALRGLAGSGRRPSASASSRRSSATTSSRRAASAAISARRRRTRPRSLGARRGAARVGRPAGPAPKRPPGRGKSARARRRADAGGCRPPDGAAARPGRHADRGGPPARCRARTRRGSVRPRRPPATSWSCRTRSSSSRCSASGAARRARARTRPHWWTTCSRCSGRPATSRACAARCGCAAGSSGSLARAEAAAEAWEEAAGHARAAGLEHERSDLLGWIASSLFWGPAPVRAAIERCEAIREEVSGDLVASADILQPLAGLHAMEGRFDEARAR